MTEIVQAAPRPAADADLALFGIESKTPPSITKYPAAFNKNAHRYWKATLEGTEYTKAREKVGATSQALWTLAIRLFLKSCAAANVYAFEGKHNYEEVAREFLTSARKQLAAYIKASGIFDVMKVKKVTRNYTFTHQNFFIEVQADLRPNDDPSVVSWLTNKPSPGFSKHVDGSYRRSVQAHIELAYTPKRDGTATLSYRIFCHTPARLLADVPNKKKLEQYVEKKLWLPICKDSPIDALRNRTF